MSVVSTAKALQSSNSSCAFVSALTCYALLPYRMFAYSGMTGEQVEPLLFYVGIGMTSTSSLAVPSMLPIPRKLAWHTGLC